MGGELSSCTSHVGVMDHWLAPFAGAVFVAGLHSELICCVWLEFIDHRVAGGAGLVVPLPVLLTVANRVMPAMHQRATKQ